MPVRFFGKRRLSYGVLACGLAVMPLSTAPVLAQTAPQITPPNFRHLPDRGNGFSVPGVRGLSAPPGAEKLFGRLAVIRIEGALCGKSA